MGSQKSALCAFLFCTKYFMITNKYSMIYNDIINRAKNRNLNGCFELHSIIPICSIIEDLEGSTDYIVKLTPKENFICHLCLLRMAENTELNSIEQNFNILLNNRRKKQITARQYESEKLKFLENKNLSQNIPLDNINNYV
jgi:hypothetical protein